MRLKSIALIGFSLFFIGCDKKEPIVTYDKNASISCLSFFPKEKELEKELLSLYNFDKGCKYRLNLEYKSDIVCNSGYNAATKTFSNFPSAFIKLEVKDGFRVIYSYYKDLNSKPTKSDLKEAFSRLQKDILKR
ncbi:MAG: hypothetical protein GXN91_03855 [Epsilonproteobacteria bacterium]|nr:hypothetical protein [Campylobacterota bacterium]